MKKISEDLMNFSLIFLTQLFPYLLYRW